jgi:uncharacterized protein YbjQ (UPF0145 family)
MTNPPAAKEPFNLKDEVRRAVASLEMKSTSTHSTTSDLSIDEELNLHSIGWEQVELVSGISVFSVPAGLWNWGQGEIAGASKAHAQAFNHAISRIHKEAADAGGHGVVGVHIERSVHPSHVEVSLLGTAVRPIGASPVKPEEVFVSDLSARDFALLMVAGWQPLGLACGASFVYAPRRQMSAVLQQSSQNIELTNFTEAMYSSRESAMERMQQMAIALKGTGVVQVNVVEGPMPFATHAVGFAAWGTVVRLAKESHQLMHPQMVVSLNDPTAVFDAATLA